MVLDKLLRALVRHWRLLAIPPLLVPLLAGPLGLGNNPPYYESWVRLWVDRPAYLRYGDDATRYRPPSQVQADRLDQLLMSQSFVNEVVSRTALAGLVETPRGEAVARETVMRGFASVPAGEHLLAMRFRANSPDLSDEMLDAILTVFRERLVTDRVNQASTAIAFYEDRLKTANEQLARSTEGVRRYLAANPRSGTLDVGRRTGTGPELPAVVLDPQLAELMRRLDLDKADVERARLALDQAGLETSAALAGQELGLQIVDPPRKPTERTIERRRLLMLPLIGLVLGCLLSAGLLVLLGTLDRTVHLAGDIGLGLPVVATIPPLHGPGTQAGELFIRRALIERAPGSHRADEPD